MHEPKHSTWVHEGHTVDDSKRIFTRQMKWYIVFQLIVSVYNLVMQWLGRVTVQNVPEGHEGFFACYGAGNQWVYESTFGEVFIFMHIFCVITQAVMIERVYYSIPHEEQVFHDELHKEEHFVKADTPNNTAVNEMAA